MEQGKKDEPGARPANSRTLRPVKGGWPGMMVGISGMVAIREEDGRIVGSPSDMDAVRKGLRACFNNHR
jgi:hypothetical protein